MAILRGTRTCHCRSSGKARSSGSSLPTITRNQRPRPGGTRRGVIMAHLTLDKRQIDRCRELAGKISAPVEKMIDTHTTVAIERTVLRLLGCDGAVKQAGQWFPEVNVIVEDLRREKALDRGALHWFVNGMIQKKMPARELAAEVASRKINLVSLKRAPDSEVAQKARELCAAAKDHLVRSRQTRDALRAKAGDPFDPEGGNGPLLYVIVATGNI